MDTEALRQDIKRRLGLAPATTGMGAFARGGANSMAESAVGLPNVLAAGAMPDGITAEMFRPKEFMEGGVPNLGPIDVIGRGIRSLTGGAVDPVAFGKQYAADPIRVGDRVLPLPSGEQVVSGVLAGKDFATGDNFNPVDAYRARMAESAQMRGEHPTAMGVGEVAGDIATLATGRLPFLNRIAKAEKTLAALGPVGSNQTVVRDVSKLLTSDAMKALYRGLGRTAETGLESATLSMLKGGDPLEAAAYGAGVQAGGSMINTLTTPIRKHPFLASALAAGAMFQMGKEFTPGGDNKFLPSLEAGFEHVAHGFIIGTAAALTTGRLRGADSSRVVQALADLTTTTGRGAVLSLITDMSKEDGGDVQRTVQALSNNPDLFNESQLKRLGSAFEDNTFGATVKDMLKTDPRFVKALEESAPDVSALRESIKERLGLVKQKPIPYGAR